MRLVVSLDDLVQIGRACPESVRKQIEGLILRSPSLTDVMGAAGSEAPSELPLRDRAMDYLTEHWDTWHTTTEIREACGLPNASALLKELKALKDEGRVEQRRARAGSGWEWKAA